MLCLAALGAELISQRPQTLDEFFSWQMAKQTPEVPVAIAPVVGATNVSPSAPLIFRALGAESCDVYYGTTSPSSNTPYTLTGVPCGTVQPSPAFAPATRHYIRYRARNRAGTSTGPVWTLTTAAESCTPQQCVLSEPSAWVNVGSCIDGQQTQERTRTIITPAACGGAACGPLRETQTVACGGPAPTKAVLKPSDLKFIGFYRYAPETGVLWWADGAITMRIKDGETRLFVAGDHTDNYPLWELRVPAAAPSLDLATAPFLTVVKNWGGFPGERFPYNWAISSLGWDDSRNAIVRNVGDVYIPPTHHVNQLVSVLNDATGTAQHFGPWRTQWIAQRVQGAYTTIPASFADKYLGGQRLAVSSYMSSGAAGSPWGASLSALQFPALTAPPDAESNPAQQSIINRGIILHTLEHRQARPDARYKHEGFNRPYDCSFGVTMTAGTLVWGGPDPGSGTGDSMQNVVWIDLPDKHGLLYFGQLVTTPAGYTAPGDPDGLVHMGYAALPGNPPACCHGQTDAYFKATGPWAHRRVAHGWIYNPDDLVASATGAAPLHSRTPAHTFQLWNTIAPWMDQNIESGAIGVGAVFDAATRRIYVPFRNDRITHAPHARPSVMVFQVQ